MKKNNVDFIIFGVTT